MSRRLDSLLLSLLPKAFRERFGRLLLDLHDDLRDNGRGSSKLGRTADLLRTAFLLRVDQITNREPRHRLESRSPTQRAHSRQKEPGMFIDSLIGSVRTTLRRASKRPAAPLAMALVLGLALGACTTVFGLVKTLLLQPLPYPNAERMVKIYESSPERGWNRFGVSPQNFDDWKERATSFDRIVAYYYAEANVLVGKEPQRIDYMLNSPLLFDLLGEQAALGRVFTAESDLEEPNTVVLSHSFWQSAFDGDAGVVGSSLRLGDKTVEVIGVMPRGFLFPIPEVELWQPLNRDPEKLGTRDTRYLSAIARLAPGVELTRAEQELSLIARTLEREFPKTNNRWSVELVPSQEWIVGDSRPILLLLQMAVLLVLLIACVNLAGLALARASTRRGEFATRAALGAQGRQLLVEVLAEGILVALIGGALGIALASLSLRAISRWPESGLPRLDELGLDPWILLASLLLTLAVGLGLGIAPALRLNRGSLIATMSRRGSGPSSRSGQRLRSLAIGVQVALSFLLLTGALLLGRSMISALEVDPGIETTGRLTFRLAPPRATLELDKPEELKTAYVESRTEADLLWTSLETAIEALPGVEAAGATNRLALKGSWWFTQVEVPGTENDPAGNDLEDELSATLRVVTPGYIRAAGVNLLEGRFFEPADHSDSQQVAVVSEEFVRRFLNDGPAVGTTIRLPNDPGGNDKRIVGVVANTLDNLEATEPSPMMYLPFAQSFQGFPDDWAMSMVVRAENSPDALLEPVRSVVEDLAPGLPMFEITTMGGLIAEATASRRVVVLVVAGFALAALLLVAVGTLGLVGESVQRDRRTIGLRMALGAKPVHVVRLVASRTVLVASLGLLAGVALSLGLSPLLSPYLFAVEGWDPSSLLLAAGLLLALVVGAASLPTRRALATDPSSVLREE